MNREDEFLQAIEDNPEDPTLLLVYADWLEEQGNPEAQTVREQAAELAVFLQQRDQRQQEAEQEQQREQHFVRVQRRRAWWSWIVGVVLCIGLFLGLWGVMHWLTPLPSGVFEFRPRLQMAFLFAPVVAFFATMIAMPLLARLHLHRGEYPEFVRWTGRVGAAHLHGCALWILVAEGLFMGIGAWFIADDAAVFTPSEIIINPFGSLGRVQTYSYDQIQEIYLVHSTGKKPCCVLLLNDGERWTSDHYSMHNHPPDIPAFTRFIAEKAGKLVQEVDSFWDIPR